MGRLLRGLAAVLVLAVGAMPARACINDREVVPAEREFKSQYQQPSPAPNSSTQPAPSQGQGMPLLFLGSCAVLLLGATVSVLDSRRRWSPE
jgi:hypothetical protein